MTHPSCESSKNIRVVIADDHAMVREGLRRIIEVEPGLQVVGQAMDTDSTLSLLSHTPCDLLLLDLTMPGHSGSELIREIRASHAALPILVVTMHNSPPIVRAALRAGANGYVTKDSDPELLVDAMRSVAAGRSWVSPDLGKVLMSEDNRVAAHERLSPRENQVMRMLVEGKTNSQIARSLFLSEKTVSTHKANILEKLTLRSTADLVRYCSEHQLGNG